jgi:putative alpha-1,2-mannosidase
VQLADQRVLRVRTTGFADSRPHAARVLLNGQAVDPQAVPHASLVRGGELHFKMQAVPAR